MEQSTKVWSIFGALIGTFLLIAVTVVVLFCWQRNKRRLRLRGFSIRSTTPLDDAEFESWRRPSQHAYSEKYGIRPARTAAVLDRVAAARLEKELGAYEFDQPSSRTGLRSPMHSPSSSIQRPEPARRKSSVASSIADRPPTPYSPTSPRGDFPRGSFSSRKSQPLIHYPSMSEASAFRFEFESDFRFHPTAPAGWL